MYKKKIYESHECPFCLIVHQKRSSFCSPLCQEKTRYRIKREQILEYKRLYQPIANELKKQRRKNNPDMYKSKDRVRRSNNLSYYREYDKIRWSKKKIKANEWKKNNPDKIKEYAKRNRIKNRETIRKYVRNKYNTDINFKLRHQYKTSIKDYIKNGSTSSRIRKLMNIDRLKEHLEYQFTDDIKWDNHGSYWHIDHRIPVTWFDLTNEQELILCWSLDNLQPKRRIENLKKGNKFAEPTNSQLQNPIILEVLNRNDFNNSK